MADLSIDLTRESQGTQAAGDLVVIDGDLVLTADVDARGTNYVMQDVVQRLRLFQGSWFLDTTQGVPYFQEILIKSPDLGQVDAVLQNTILSVPGVLQLASYKSSASAQRRTLSLEFVIVTQLGTVSYSDTLSATGVRN